MIHRNVESQNPLLNELLLTYWNKVITLLSQSVRLLHSSLDLDMNGLGHKWREYYNCLSFLGCPPFSFSRLVIVLRGFPLWYNLIWEWQRYEYLQIQNEGIIRDLPEDDW